MNSTTLSAGQVDELRATLNEISGGSTETEASEVTSRPTGAPWYSAVTTATAAACRRKTRRSASGPVSDQGGVRAAGSA